MIKIEVLSEEKNWSKKIKKKKHFFNLICRSFPKKYRFLNKKFSLTLLLSNNKNIKCNHELGKIMTKLPSNEQRSFKQGQPNSDDVKMKIYENN